MGPCGVLWVMNLPNKGPQGPCGALGGMNKPPKPKRAPRGPTFLCKSNSPNKRSEEGFLLALYRITFANQDFPSPVAADLPRLA